MRQVFLSLGSARVRLALGLLLAGLLMTQIISSFESQRSATARPAPPAVFVRDDQTPATSHLHRLEELAKTDHAALLRLALENYNRTYRDYACTLTKQERLSGRLGDAQVVDVKFREGPFSVLMTWKVNPGRGDKMLYVEDDPSGNHKMYVRPTSAIARRLVPVVERSPNDPEVLKSSLRSISDFGFARSLQSLIKVYEEAQARGHLLEFSYLGHGKVDGRPTLGIKRVLPPGQGYPAHVTVVQIDQEYLVPVHVQGTDWQNQLLCDYVFSNIQFNVGLTKEDFTRKANGL